MKSGHFIYKTRSGRILLVVLAILFTLCAGPANAAPQPGTITIVFDAEPENLDPGNSARSYVGPIMMNNVVESLTDFNYDDSSISPKLATSWKQIDKTTWHFFLQKGVKFHDGADFNAEAVIFNIKRVYDKRIVTGYNKFFGGVKMKGKALDSHTLELKTISHQPLLLTLLSALPICSPNTPGGKLIRNPIGTGPYKFVKWDAGTQIVLEYFDGYWGKQPQVKKAIFLWRKESSIRASMVKIGEADLTPYLAAEDATDPVMDVTYLNTESVVLRVGGNWDPPLNDRRFRMALNLAVDRDAIRGSILSKDVVPLTQIVVPNIFGHNPDLKVWPYDPQKAKQLLKEARKDGVPVDKEIMLIGRIAHFPGVAELLEAVTNMYKAIGLNVKLKMLETGVYRPFQNNPMPTDAKPYLLEFSHDNNKGDAAFTAFHNYHSGGKNSSTRDKKLDSLIEKAQAATGEERRKLWQSTFKRIHDDIISNVMLFHMVGFARVGKRINFKPSIETVIQIQLDQITFK
jgi:peptide/nickel transport system substrate-binding protein